MHYFLDLFDKVLYMFRTGPPSIIRSISILYTRSKYLSCYMNIQWCISQTQPNFMIIVVLWQYVSIFIESSSGPSKILEGPEDDCIRIEACCPNTIINIIKFRCVWLIHHCILTLQRGVTSTARHSVNINCRGVTSPARHAARSHSFVYISTS